MVYSIDQNQALLAWATLHGLWAQKFDPPGVKRPAPADMLRRMSLVESFPTSGADQHPTRVSPHAHTDDRCPSVLVVHEGGRGRAGLVAQTVANALVSRGADSPTGAIDELAPARVGEADAVILGCWTPGKTPFGDEPARRLADWIDALPSLAGKPVGVFCVYRFFPHTFADMAARVAETERKLVTRLESKGAEIAARRAIHFRSIGADAAELADRVLDRTQAA